MDCISPRRRASWISISSIARSRQRQVDVIAGDATSGLIKALDLAMLQDNRAYFPPYYAVPIVRSAVLLAHPEVRDALARLAGRISEDDMRAMNAAVDVDHRDVRGDRFEEFLHAASD